MSLLDSILAEKRTWAASNPHEPTRPRAVDLRPTYATLLRSKRNPMRLIAEIKFRSPSAGQLSSAMGAGERALCYERSGAHMISVLTDGRHFGGSFTDVMHAHNATRIPILCKDFIIDERQVAHAYGCGADAVLLIARCLPGRELRHLATAVRKRGMEPFFEIFDDAELERVLDLNPKVIGVNARDLDTLKIDKELAARVLTRIPLGIVAVHLSGIHTPSDVASISAGRADAALIGESLMRCDDPTSHLKSLIAATL